MVKALAEFHKDSRFLCGRRPDCKECKRAQNKKGYKENKPKRMAYKKEQIRGYRKEPAFRMKEMASKHVYNALKNQGSTKGGSTFSALPYSPQDLVEHLERQFDEKMNWDNYGEYWHVDHIYPQSLLPYSSLEEENFQKCWALDNLQPLEAIENIRKSNKVLRHSVTKIAAVDA